MRKKGVFQYEDTMGRAHGGRGRMREGCDRGRVKWTVDSCWCGCFVRKREKKNEVKEETKVPPKNWISSAHVM